MCFTILQTSKAVKLENRFQAKFEHQDDYKPSGGTVNGFAFPYLPIITQDKKEVISLFQWGLLPSWTKDINFRKNTLNARVETVYEKPSFKSSVNNRCLILIDGFYEYHWLDPKGTAKQKYLMSFCDDEPFALGGLWNTWTDRNTGEVVPTFSILTTEANEQMAEIHNSKKRMPIILTKENEQAWLYNEISLNTEFLELFDTRII